uniref:Profilin n=1 Tax=Cyprinus carpio TaxID=7962 RepID=A0A8C2FGT0_CYPCA
MSWDSYITSLTKSEWVDDAVILGCTPGQESVWAAAPGGCLDALASPPVLFRIFITESGAEAREEAHFLKVLRTQAAVFSVILAIRGNNVRFIHSR